MEQNVVNSVLRHARKGRKILMGRSHDGTVKIKVNYGVKGLMTKRYVTDQETYLEIRKQLRVSDLEK